jgi:hypothetical protein
VATIEQVAKGRLRLFTLTLRNIERLDRAIANFF